jgi:hypothetical protein
MATEAKIGRFQGSSSGIHRRSSVQVRESEPLAKTAIDLIFLHRSEDGPWAATLAERLEPAGLENCNLTISLAECDSSTGLSSLSELGTGSLSFRFLAIVVSEGMVRNDWPAAQHAIMALKESAPPQLRIVTILKDNVTLPAMLRMGEWFDFREEKNPQGNLLDLATFLKTNSGLATGISAGTDGLRPEAAKSGNPIDNFYSTGVSATKERILSNLFPLAELPKFVYSVETRFRNDSELTEACVAAGPLAFLLKGSRLYTMEPLSPNSLFAPAVVNWETREQEEFGTWLSSMERAGWAVELLDRMFRHHAWKRGLRWDKATGQYFFPRTKPKSIWWEIGGRTVSREVTAPHMEWIDVDTDVRAEVQYGWKHQSIRAAFVLVSGTLFLQLTPGWLLTELDGKTPAGTQPVGPIFSGSRHQERNGRILRAIRFWSAVLAKGHHEIRINTGQAPIRAKLTPLSGFTPFGLPCDRMDYDQLMLAETEDDLLIPALGPLGQKSTVDHEEGIPSETFRNSRTGPRQARI